MATVHSQTLTRLPEGHPCGTCGVRDLGLCAALDEPSLVSFRGMGGALALRDGQPLFHEGDRACEVYTVTRGGLKLYRLMPDGRRQVMGFAFPGDHVGGAIGEKQPFTAEAMHETSTCRFARSRFEEFVDEHPAMERELHRVTARQLAEAREQMLLLGRKSARERLATFLLGLLERRERPTGQIQSHVDLAMSRSDIADYLGMTKETVSRVLALLKNRRLVRLAALDRVEVLDRPALARMAEGLD